jgi:hypothetical protein
VQDRQAYLGRRVTITRSLAGTWASLRLRLDNDLLARQVRGQMAPVGAAALYGLAHDDLVAILSSRVLSCERRLDVLER